MILYFVFVVVFYNVRFFRKDYGADKVSQSADAGAKKRHEPQHADDSGIDIEIFRDSAAYAANFLSFFYFINPFHFILRKD